MSIGNELHKVPYAMGQRERNLSDLFKLVFLVTWKYYSTLTLTPKYADYLNTNECMRDP